MSDQHYPGSFLKDEGRSPLGLGWEYRRRGWGKGECPFVQPWQVDQFCLGYENFVCSDPRVNEAMLREFSLKRKAK
jgi:hypothetical protein